MEKLTESLEDYLEVIFTEIEKNKTVRAIDISRKLNVSRASVTEALNRLKEKGFINYEKYGDISINEKGTERATQIILKHKELTLFFLNLGIEQKEAGEVACKFEHIITENIKDKIIKFNLFCKENPDFKL